MQKRHIGCLRASIRSLECGCREIHGHNRAPPLDCSTGVVARGVFLAASTAETGDFVRILVNENQRPVFKMRTMPMFTLFGSRVHEDGTEIAAGDVVKAKATAAMMR